MSSLSLDQVKHAVGGLYLELLAAQARVAELENPQPPSDSTTETTVN